VSISLNELVKKVESLGLDIQPLIDFQNAVTLQQVEESDYLQILNTLKNQLSKTYSIRQKPMSIQLLLDRLRNKMQTELTIYETDASRENNSNVIVNNSVDLGGVQGIVSEEGRKSKDISLAILDELRSMKEEMQNIKEQKNTIVVREGSSIDSARPEVVYESDGVFVNPIDESRVNKLKPKINIESKKGSSDIKGRIKRLKELKNGS